jgi:undecaprenyl-diphosphatase
MEETFIINLQKSSMVVFDFMNVVSVPFHLTFFLIIITILYYENLMTLEQYGLLMIGQLINGALKFIIRRKRPYMASNKIINHEKLKLDYYSFPSGHAFNAFLLFYILRQNDLVNNYFKIIPYLVAVSRVSLGVHYPTDVIAGGILAKLVFLISSNWLSIK